VAEPWYRHFVLGGNLRMTEFQAAILLAQLTRLEEQTLRRQTNAAMLDAELRDMPGITVLAGEPRLTRRSYYFYVFRVVPSVLGITRDTFVRALAAEGVPATAGWPTPLYENPLFQRNGDGPQYCPRSCPYYGKETDYSKVSCPVCEQVCSDACWIPQRVLLAEPEAMHAVVTAVSKVCTHSREAVAT
jgi:dTDP-4-amino-4,6-dideoxygalactose transaminase